MITDISLHSQISKCLPRVSNKDLPDKVHSPGKVFSAELAVFFIAEKLQCNSHFFSDKNFLNNIFQVLQIS